MAIDKKSILFVFLAFVLLGISFLAYKLDLSLTGFLVQGKADLTVTVIDGSNNHPLRDARIYVKDVDKDTRLTYVGRTNRNGQRTARLNEGTYTVEVTDRDYTDSSFSVLLLDGDERDVSVVVYPNDYTKTCTDGTLLNTCAEPQPWHCNSEAVLTKKCDLCGCPQGLRCTYDGSCI